MLSNLYMCLRMINTKIEKCSRLEITPKSVTAENIAKQQKWGKNETSEETEINKSVLHV
jgi:hypothetical protein